MADIKSGRYSEAGSWDELLGGNQLVGSSNVRSKGVFAQFPASTPKYNTGSSQTETMARLLVPLPDVARQRFINSFGADSESRKLAEMLAVSTDTAGRNGAFGMGYIDFLLTAAMEIFDEKVQVVDVLSDNFVQYFFGERPPIFQYRGKLLNTKQDDWRNAFSVIYNSIIRGTQLARRRRLVTLTYDNVAVTGTIIGMNQTLSAELEMAADFSIKFLVKRFDVYRMLNTVPNPPSKFPNNVVDPSTFGGLQLKRVHRTMRVVGDPEYVTSKPKAKEKEEEKKKTPELEQVGNTPEAGQRDDNIYNGPSPSSEKITKPFGAAVKWYR